MATAKHQDLTHGSIYRHLLRLSIPASLGMIFNTLYNLTDFWFAGLLSDQALAGVSIAGSVFFLLIAIGAGVQTGTAAVIASEVGRKRFDEVSTWLNNATGLGLVIAVVTLLLGYWIADEMVLFLGAEPDITPFAQRYLNITLAGNVAFVLAAVAAGALIALGDTASNRNALAVGFFANFVLNPLLTFVLDFGVAGLALATVIIKAGTAVYLFAVLKRRLSTRCRPALQRSHWRELLYQVLPASGNMLTIILGGFITVAFVGRFGSEHVAGYAVGLRLEQVLLLPALGLNAAVMAVAGQNFGAGNPLRVAETYRKSLRLGLAMAACSIPVMIFLSPQLMSLFSENTEIQATGATYLRIDAIAFYGYVVLFISVASLQAIKQPLFPLIMGTARQLIVPACVNYLLIVVWGYPMVWLFYSVVAIVLVSAVISYLYVNRRLAEITAIAPLTED